MKLKRITYIDIPDEATQIIEYPGYDIDDICFDEITCVKIISNNSIRDLLEFIHLIRENKPDIKICISGNNINIPYNANVVDYYETANKELYMNISEDASKVSFIDITNKIVRDIEKLNPLAIFYFDMFDELKTKNEKI